MQTLEHLTKNSNFKICRIKHLSVCRISTYLKMILDTFFTLSFCRIVNGLTLQCVYWIVAGFTCLATLIGTFIYVRLNKQKMFNHGNLSFEILKVLLAEQLNILKLLRHPTISFSIHCEVNLYYKSCFHKSLGSTVFDYRLLN